MQPVRRVVRIGIFVVVVSTLLEWYSIAANYSYAALAGTYTLRSSDQTCALHLRPDRTFTEELNRQGVTQKAHGQWDRYGEAHVSFSSEFLKLSGQELNASSQAHGQFDKALGLFPSLTLAPLPDGPRLRKKPFS